MYPTPLLTYVEFALGAFAPHSDWNVLHMLRPDSRAMGCLWAFYGTSAGYRTRDIPITPRSSPCIPPKYRTRESSRQRFFELYYIATGAFLQMSPLPDGHFSFDTGRYPYYGSGIQIFHSHVAICGALVNTKMMNFLTHTSIFSMSPLLPPIPITHRTSITGRISPALSCPTVQRVPFDIFSAPHIATITIPIPPFPLSL